MGFLKTNYDDLQGDFKPLPVGEYDCKISEAKVATAATSGNQMLKLKLTVREDVEQEGQRRIFFHNCVVSEKTMFQFHQLTKAVGFPAGTEFDSLEELARAVLYKNVTVKNKHELYNGQMQDKVASLKESKDANPFEETAGKIDITEDDLPF